MKNIPEIRNVDGIPTLYVKGEPFFALSGEVHNSSAEGLEYMEQNVWPRLEGLHMNTLIVPLYWDRIEEKKDQYCYELPDGLVRQARERGMHLIFLWFGLWKNADSNYVPGWIKQDTKNYFRAEKVNGEKLNTISPFCQAAVERDAQAFAHVMAHIREIDEDESTVIMMQVENEVGLLGTAADYCEPAREAFKQQVPDILLSERDAFYTEGNLPSGSWREVFGEDAEEVFMAYYFAKALEQIAAAGRKEYPLPCFANNWLKQHPWYAGSYPSGGPVREMHGIWKTAAPSLFTLAPDIYVPYVAQTMKEWDYETNPLLVPEARRDAVTASYAMYALTHHHALCYAPFGIEDLGLTPEELPAPPPEMMAALNIDPASFDIRGTREALGSVYSLFEEMLPLYLKYRGTRHMKCFLKQSEEDKGIYLKFQNYDLEISYFPKAPGCPVSAGVIYELSESSFIIAGMMGQFTFHPKAGENKNVGFLRKESGTVQCGEWQTWQIQNGDENGNNVLGNQPTCFYLELYKY